MVTLSDRFVVFAGHTFQMGRPDGTGARMDSATVRPGESIDADS